MTLDFTLAKYEELMRCLLDSGYAVRSVAEYLACAGARSPTDVVLRHDVDRFVGRALAMARLEHRMGVHSTYYFRTTRRVFKPDAIAEIACMGHEVGYHYEVLDKTRGDQAAASALFAMELAAFRQMAEVKTCAMHGNPLTRWDNRDLWEKCSWKDFGLLGEAYLSFHDVVYLSDTGRTWSPRNKVKDWMPGGDGRVAAQPDVRSTDDLIRWLGSGDRGPVYLTAHPERWQDGPAQWMASATMDLGVNVVKRVLLRHRSH